MTEESRKQAVEMFNMRLDGYSYTQIAEKYGITRQRVEQILCHREPTKRKRISLDYIIYPGLKKWVVENNMSLVAVHRLISNGESNNPQFTKKKLTGKSKVNIDDIKKLISASGLTFEQLFLSEQQEGE